QPIERVAPQRSRKTADDTHRFLLIVLANLSPGDTLIFREDDMDGFSHELITVGIVLLRLGRLEQVPTNQHCGTAAKAKQRQQEQSSHQLPAPPSSTRRNDERLRV